MAGKDAERILHGVGLGPGGSIGSLTAISAAVDAMAVSVVRSMGFSLG